jgi:hypothetical protein
MISDKNGDGVGGVPEPEYISYPIDLFIRFVIMCKTDGCKSLDNGITYPFYLG